MSDLPATASASDAAPAVVLPEVVVAALRTFARRRRCLDALRGLGEAAGVLVVLLLLVALADRLLRPEDAARQMLAVGAWLAAGGWALWRGAWPALRRRDAAWWAAGIEAAAGDLDERLVSAVGLAGRVPPAGISRWMITRTVALAAEALATRKVAALADAGPARRAWRRSGLALLAVVVKIALVFTMLGVFALAYFVN